MAADLRQRMQPPGGLPTPTLGAGAKAVPATDDDGRMAHPSGKEKNDRLTQLLRGLSFGVYFFSSCLASVPSSLALRGFSSL